MELVGDCGWARFGSEHVSIGSEGNLCAVIAYSSFTTDGPTVKPIVYSGFLGCVWKQIYHAVGLGLFDAGCLHRKPHNW